MDMLVEVLLEFLQTVIKRVKGGAGILWTGEIPAQTSDFANQSASSIVFLRHHRDRVGNRSEAAMGLGSPTETRISRDQQYKGTEFLLPSPGVA